MIGRLNKEQVEEVLKSNVLGRLGCKDDQRMYIVPINYVYDGKAIIAHSILGMKIIMMRANPEVCFLVDELASYTNWKSVITWGLYQELHDERERYAAMKLFNQRMLHLKISQTAIPPDLEVNKDEPGSLGNVRPIIFRIILTDKTGRFEKSG